MNNNKNDFIVKLLLVIEFAVFVFGCAILFALLPKDRIIVLLTANVCSIIFLYSLLRHRQTKNINDYITKMSLYLDSVYFEKNSHIAMPLDDEAVHEFCDKVAYIKEYEKTKENNRHRILNIVNSVAANMEIENLLEDLMPKLIDVTNSNCGAFYLYNSSTNKLGIKHSIGFSKNIYSEFDLILGEGFIGSAAMTKEIKIIKEMPDDTNYMIRTFIGKIKPKSIMVVPIVNREQLLGVFAFASIYEYSDDQLETVNLIKYYVGATVGNGLTYEKTKRMSNELKFQNRLIQNLNEDLENKVQERTMFLNDIIDGVKDCAIYATDLEGVIQVWNKSAEAMYTYTAKEAIGKHISSINLFDETLSKPETKSHQECIDIAVKEGKHTENIRRYRNDGSSYYAEVTLLSRYNSKGEIIGFTNVTKDITSLKNMENALWKERVFSSKLIETSTRALVFADEEGFIYSLNNNAEKILGMDVVGRQIYDFFEDSDGVANDIESLPKTMTNAEIKAIMKDTRQEIKIVVNILTNKMEASSALFFYLEPVV